MPYNMVYIPNDSIEDTKELGIFYKADTKRVW